MKDKTTSLTIEALDEHTWMLSEGSGRGRTHCYLLEGTTQAVLIDTGLNLLDLKSICASLTTKEVMVINTHGHLDHVTNNHQFKTVYLHPADEAIWKEHRSTLVRYQFMKQRLLDKKIDLTPSLEEELKKQATLPLQQTYLPLQDDTLIDLGQRRLRVIATPGHTQGSICILDTRYRRVFTGDTICEDGVLLHFPHSTSLVTYQASLCKLQAMQDHFDLLYPGHQTTPLPAQLLQDYMTCAQLIIEEKVTPVKSISAAGIGYRATYQHATISYTPKQEV